jgi:nucleoside-diphosphate-sugar epimerase
MKVWVTGKIWAGGKIVMDNILVTGGSGFIGSNLVKRLVREGYRVRVFDNNFRGSRVKLGETINDIDFYEGDIRNFDQVNQAFIGIDTVFHLAFINGTKYFYEIPETVLEVGVKGAMNALDAAVANHVQRFILASSSEIYHEPVTIPTPETERAIIPDVMNPRYSYSGGKLISELLVINYGRKHCFEIMIFRPHNIYGPDMGSEHVIPEFIQRMRELSNGFQNQPLDFPIQGSGQETRAFCYIDDFVDGIMRMLERGQPGEIYNIGNDEEVTIEHLAYQVAELLHLNIRIIHHDLQKGGATRRCPDVRKLKQLGYQPRVSLQEGLLKTIEWYLNSK